MSALGFQIFQEGSENAGNAALRKTKNTDMQVKQPATKRAALGVISSNTRVQPFRAAKQQGAQEGFSSQENASQKTFGQQPAFAFPGTGQPFSIHIDDETSNTKTSNPFSSIPQQSRGLQLHPSVAQLGQLPPIHDVIEIQDSPCAASPMILDQSMDTSRLTEETSESRLDKLLSVQEYSDEIYQYIRQAELKHRPKPSYIRKQPDITPSMRCILIDWLIEVAEEYKLHRETIFLAVNYIDRFLSQMSVLRGKLQLVGAAATFLAAKYEEIYPPEVGEFVYITDDTYTAKQVLRMEHLILKVLSFDVAVPTINLFCEKFLKDSSADEQTKCLSMYLAELTLIEAETYLNHTPSIIAASCIFLSRHTLGLEAWPRSLSESTGYQPSDFEQCLQELHQTYINAPGFPQQAIREKYKQEKFQEVSLICPPATLPGGMLV